MSKLEATRYVVEVHDHPTKYLSPRECHRLSSELRDVASTALFPLPDYQCLTTAPSALDNKLVITARRGDSEALVAFTSCVYLSIDDVGTVIHTGLTCIVPDERRTGVTLYLFYRIFTFLAAKYPQGVWLTSLSEVTSSMVNICRYIQNVYPSPTLSAPSPTHLRIARVISEKYRVEMLISPSATFEERDFVFRGSNLPGSPFRKDPDDPKFHHRSKVENDYYRTLLRKDAGDEVLQIGFVDPDAIMAFMKQDRFVSLLWLLGLTGPKL